MLEYGKMPNVLLYVWACHRAWEGWYDTEPTSHIGMREYVLEDQVIERLQRRNGYSHFHLRPRYYRS